MPMDFASYDVHCVQVFQVRKVSGSTSGKIFAMKVLKKVSDSAFVRSGLWFLKLYNENWSVDTLSNPFLLVKSSNH